MSGSLAPRIPAIKGELDLSDGRLGVALTGFAVGLFAGTRAAAWLIDRLGSRAVVRISLPIFAGTLLGPALAGDLVALTAALALFGALAGVLDVGMNAQGVAVERAYRRPIMSALHGVWSLGLLASAALASGAAALDLGLLLHFGLAAVLLALAAVAAPAGLLSPADEGQPERSTERPRARRVLWSAAVPALGAIGFSSYLGEGAAADWSGVYVHDNLGAGSGVAALAFTAFALGMVAARFTADRFSARFGPVAVARAGGLVAGAGLALGLAITQPGVALVSFALLGLGLGPVVPIVFSAAGNLGGTSGSVALGWVVTVSYVGSVLGPAAIGAVAEAASLRAGLVLPVLLCLVIAGLARFVESAAGGQVWGASREAVARRTPPSAVA